MPILMSVLVLAELTIIAFLLLLILRVTGEVSDSLEKSPFECGFEPVLRGRGRFTMQFFRVSLVFLIFDAELILLFPLLMGIPGERTLSGVSLAVVFFCALSAGVVYEWGAGVLDWFKFWPRISTVNRESGTALSKF